MASSCSDCFDLGDGSKLHDEVEVRECGKWLPSNARTCSTSCQETVIGSVSTTSKRERRMWGVSGRAGERTVA